MKVCVYGAGAVGSLIAAKLSAMGHSEISLVARGQALESLQKNGIGLEIGSDRKYYSVASSSSPAALGKQDLVVIAVKQPSLNQVINDIAPLLRPDTKVLVAMNGVPWWFFDGLKQAPKDKVLRTLDPDGLLRGLLPTEHIIGCVVHLACSVPEPGVSSLKAGNRLIIGEPLGGKSETLLLTAKILTDAGFGLQITDNIHREIWFKLWGNMTMNPISALTRMTTDRILDDPLANQFCCRIMSEAANIGSIIGLPIEQSPAERNAVTRELGAMKTSMLQDVEKGSPLEFESLIGVVHEIAEKTGLDAPNIATLYGLIRLYANSMEESRDA